MSSHRRRRSWLRWVLVGAAAVVVLAVGVPFVYIHFIEGPAPAPLGLGATASPGATVPGQAAADMQLAGTWTVGSQSITADSHAQVTLAYHASYVYLDVDGTGTLTVSADGTTKVIHVSGAPDIYSVATKQPAKDGTVSVALSPGLAAYSFTFG